jgi:hypothetical protein
VTNYNNIAFKIKYITDLLIVYPYTIMSLSIRWWRSVVEVKTKFHTFWIPACRLPHFFSSKTLDHFVEVSILPDLVICQVHRFVHYQTKEWLWIVYSRGYEIFMEYLKEIHRHSSGPGILNQSISSTQRQLWLWSWFGDCQVQSFRQRSVFSTEVCGSFRSGVLLSGQDLYQDLLRFNNTLKDT